MNDIFEQITQLQNTIDPALVSILEMDFEKKLKRKRRRTKTKR